MHSVARGQEVVVEAEGPVRAASLAGLSRMMQPQSGARGPKSASGRESFAVFSSSGVPGIELFER